jgi:hypothetical protein
MLSPEDKKKIEDLVKSSYNNVQNFNIDKDDDIYFTLTPRMSKSRFGGYDVDEIYDLETKNGRIKLNVEDAHIEDDSDGEDPWPKKLLCVTYKASIDDEIEENAKTMKHIKLFEDFKDAASKKDILRAFGFAKEVERGEKGPLCGDAVRMEDFRDEKSRREFGISGLCQKCQDKIFAEPNESLVIEGFMGMRDWRDSDTAADFMSNIFDNVVKNLKAYFDKEITKKNSSFNTPGYVNVILAAKKWYPFLNSIGDVEPLSKILKKTLAYIDKDLKDDDTDPEFKNGLRSLKKWVTSNT